MCKRYLIATTFALIFALAFTTNLDAQTCPGSAGCLDDTFGNGGTTLVNFSFIVPAPEGMVVQSDGKIISVSGGFQSGHKLVRLNADGSPDLTFGGGDGEVDFEWKLVSGTAAYYGKAYGLALQSVGGQDRIIVAGSGHRKSGKKVSGNLLRVQGFMPDGSVDSSFGTDGSVVHNTGYALTVAVQPDGKVVTVGDLGNLARLKIDGSLDAAFGTGGIVTSGYGRALAIDSGAGILVGGYQRQGNGPNNRVLMSVKRYLSNGLLDTNFGNTGVATADFGISAAAVWQLQIDSAGNIVAVSSTSTPTSFAIARFTPDGQPDLTFNGTGLALGPEGDARGLALQGDGKPVVTGRFNEDLRLVRFNNDGTVDTAFGIGGVVTMDVFSRDYTYRSRIQIDPACNCEKIVMSGGTSPFITFSRFHTF